MKLSSKHRLTLNSLNHSNYYFMTCPVLTWKFQQCQHGLAVGEIAVHLAIILVFLVGVVSVDAHDNRFFKS